MTKVNLDQESTTTPEVTTGINTLFASPTASLVYNGSNQLALTAHLTQLSTEITNKVLAVASNPDFAPKIVAAQKSHDAMDDLINECHPLGLVDIEFLIGIEEDELDKMIRSQQSKRSRAKGKTMTLDNFKVMMIGGVAENLLRLAGNKAKSTGGGATMGDIGYSESDLEALALDPEELKKAIRNVQSKKSIMKSKAEFADEAKRLVHPRWLALENAEAQLKAIRDQGNAQLNEQAKQAIEARDQANELLADIDADTIPPEEAARILRSVKEMLITR